MTVLLEYGATLTVTDDGSLFYPMTGEIADDDPFWIELIVDDRAAVAYAKRFQRVGVRLDVGGVTLPDREVGDALTISESSGSFGDRCTIKLVGSRFSPFARGLIRSRADVGVYLKFGSPGSEFGEKVFSGCIVTSGYDAQPPTADVQCLDGAGFHAEKRLKDYSVPPNSKRSRLAIVLEMCGLASIPVGHMDLGGDGGIVTKPVVPGDQPILQFIAEFLAILGVEIGFENGLLVARRFDPDLPPVMELNPGNIIVPAGISSPDTLAPNEIGVVSVSFSRIEPTGLRTEETSVVKVAPYAPLGVTPSAELVQVVSEIITKVSYLGSLDKHTEEEEYGFYAVLAAPSQIQPIEDPPGYEIVPTSATVYAYPDGTTRGDPRERLRRISRRVMSKDVDANMNVIHTREERYFFHFLRKAVWRVSAGGEDVLQTMTNIPITDDGQGVLGGREVMGLLGSAGVMEGGLPASSAYLRPDALTEVFFTLASDGSITEKETREYFYDIGSARRRAEDAYGYGVDTITYASLPAETDASSGHEWGGLRITTERYRAIDEEHYQVSSRITLNGKLVEDVPPHRIAGALPRPERAEAESASQEIRYVVVDGERVALAGETIQRIDHNEFVENSAEAAVFARHLARKASARKLDTEIGIETLLHKWRAVTVNLPGASIDGLKFFVTDVERNVATNREAITAEYYSPELW